MSTVHGIAEWGERSTPLPKQLIYVFSLDLLFHVAEKGSIGANGGAVVMTILPEVDIRDVERSPVDPCKKGGKVLKPGEAAVKISKTKQKAKGQGFTYHVRDEVLIRAADGVVHDVPHGDVRYADDRLNVEGSGAGTLNGRALLAVDEGGTVSVEYTGVVAMTRDVVATLAEFEKGEKKEGKNVPVGTACISMRSASKPAKYRWLMENQLFGFGRIIAVRTPEKSSSKKQRADEAIAPAPWYFQDVEARPSSPHLLFTYDMYMGG